MGQYGNRFNEYIFESSYNSLLLTLEDTNAFIFGLTESTVLTEGAVFDRIKEKILTIFDKVIKFIASIPGKIKALYEKFRRIIKRDPDFDKNGFPNKGFDGTVKYDKELYDYVLASQYLLEHVQDIAKEFKFDKNTDYEKKLNEFNEKKMHLEDQDFFDKFIKKYEITNATSKYLKDHFEKFEGTEILKMKEEINSIKKSVESSGNWIKTTLDSKFNDKEEILLLTRYTSFISALSTEISKVLIEIIRFDSMAVNQYLAIEKFISSCYNYTPFKPDTFKPETF